MDEAYSSAYNPITGRERSHAPAPPEPDVPPGAGMLMFAGCVLALIGVVNFIYGLAAISNSSYFVRNAEYAVSGLKTWGWVMLIVGLVQILAALAIWREASWGRWVGIASAALNAMAQIMWLQSYPLAALALFAVDIIVLYGLLVYGDSHTKAVQTHSVSGRTRL